jgi:uncharacterized protein (TIGR03083 family)
MPAFYNRSEVLAALDRERANWQALVEDVGPDRMEEPDVAGDWTFKDVAAHLSYWMEDIIRTLELVADEKPVDIPARWPEELTDPEAINQWAYEQSRGRTVEDVLAEADEGYARMRRALERMPEETINSTEIFDWQQGEPFSQWLIDRRLFNHFYREHEAGIREWLMGGNPTV